MSSPHNFPLILFTEMMKIPYFSYEKLKLVLCPLNKCRIMFALIGFDMGTCFNMFEEKKSYKEYMEKSEAMTSSTHSFAYCLRNISLIITKSLTLPIFLIFLSDLHQIFPVTVLFNMFYSFYWINLINLDWISPLGATYFRHNCRLENTPVVHPSCIARYDVTSAEIEVGVKVIRVRYVVSPALFVRFPRRSRWRLWWVRRRCASPARILRSCCNPTPCNSHRPIPESEKINISIIIRRMKGKLIYFLLTVYEWSVSIRRTHILTALIPIY